mgnify:CR=1 FL=1
MASKSLEELRALYGGLPSSSQKNRPPMMGGGMRGRGGNPALHGKPKDMKSTLNKLLAYIGKYKLLLILAIFCMVISTAVSLIGSYVLRPVINSIDDSKYKTEINGEESDELVISGKTEGKTLTATVTLPEREVESYRFTVNFPGDELTLIGARLPEENAATESEDCLIIQNEDSVSVLSKDGAKINAGATALTLEFSVKNAGTTAELSFSKTNTAENVLISLLKVLLMLVFIYLTGVVASFTQARLMLKVSQNAVEKIRNDLFCKMQELPVSVYDKSSAGELMSRYTNDVDNIGVMLDNSVISLISGSINIVGTLAMMAYTNIWLTLIILVFMPIFTFGGAAIMKLSRKYYSAQQSALGSVNGYIEESVSGQKVTKVFCREDISVEEFSKLNEYMRDKQIGAQFWGGVMGPIMGNLGRVGYALVAGVGGLLCIFRGFDVGGLSIFVNYSIHFSRPINELSAQMATVFSALAGAERVFALMDTAPETADSKDAVSAANIRGDVVFENVSFSYVEGKQVLKNITLYAHPGQKIAFVGSTGAGKTTVMNLLPRFYDIEEGSITIDGVDIKKYRRKELREKVAMVLQDTKLFTGTVMENIRYGRLDATDQEVIEAAKTASAHSFITKLADGYNTYLDGDGANLSQGQRQLLNIARAALSKAPILILDEATSSVDSKTEKMINEGMSKLMENRTTFVIAHRLSTISDSDCIMVLERGEIIERGTQKQLIEQKGRYYELYMGLRELD